MGRKRDGNWKETGRKLDRKKTETGRNLYGKPDGNRAETMR